MDNPEWTEYVMRQFEANELWKGLPKVDGLRRVAIKLLGSIVNSTTKTIQTPTVANENHATVEHSYTFMWDNNPNDLRTFSDVADTYAGNTPEPFSKHAPAVASTKAKGRALREALNLIGILAAEEMMPTIDAQENINTSQITTVNTLCQRLDIDVLKLLASAKPPVERIEELPYTRAVTLIKLLNEYQGKKEIPDKIKGYNENWR